MCFYHDYQWYAMVSESTDAIANEPVRCDECGQMIPAGAFVRHVFQQEAEECLACENGDCECSKDGGQEDCCQCEEPDFGETFEYDRCEGCHKFLEAIKLAEIAEGCAESEALPAMPMWDDLQGIGRDGCKRYWITASKTFPAWRRHFALLWRLCFG